jgi:hypothetical protein
MEHQSHQETDKIYYQPDLFKGDSEVASLRDQQSGLRSSLDKLRKGLFRRFDELSKMVMQVILRQDERDLEMAKMKSRLDGLEKELLQGTRSNRNVRTLHIVGQKKDITPFYMLDR